MTPFTLFHDFQIRSSRFFCHSPRWTEQQSQLRPPWLHLVVCLVAHSLCGVYWELKHNKEMQTMIIHLNYIFALLISLVGLNMRQLELFLNISDYIKFDIFYLSDRKYHAFLDSKDGCRVSFCFMKIEKYATKYFTSIPSLLV